MRIVDCTYKEEQYTVRDNGEVYRHSRAGKRLRPKDNQWTIGELNNKTGYMEIGTVPVHRIVATAFYGEPPTKGHVVDHKDTVRRNNSPENLRWVTRLENILLNSKTAKRIAAVCGSVEAFLADPSKFQDKFQEWQNQYVEPIPDEPDIIIAKTSNAVQRGWKVPSEFPCCPQESVEPISDYAEKLKEGSVFCVNSIYSSLVSKCAISEDRQSIYVISKSTQEENAVKPWALAKITYENGQFVHTGLHNFYTQEGAEKQFCLAQGLEWLGADSIDDYC